MTNLILNVCAVVSNAVVATVPMELKPVYERVKVFDDPDCFPCHRPELMVIADCTCKWSVIPTHYVIVQKNAELEKVEYGDDGHIKSCTDTEIKLKKFRAIAEEGVKDGK